MHDATHSCGWLSMIQTHIPCKHIHTHTHPSTHTHTDTNTNTHTDTHTHAHTHTHTHIHTHTHTHTHISMSVHLLEFKLRPQYIHLFNRLKEFKQEIWIKVGHPHCEKDKTHKRLKKARFFKSNNTNQHANFWDITPSQASKHTAYYITRLPSLGCFFHKTR